MAAAEILKLTHIVDNKVTTVVNDIRQLAHSIDDVKWNQVRESLRRWVTPTDPSTNHNIACGIQHGGTAQWFSRSGISRKWKSTGSLLWIHGKPGSGKSILCSAIIQDIETLCKAGLASNAYFYLTLGTLISKIVETSSHLFSSNFLLSPVLAVTSSAAFIQSMTKDHGRPAKLH
jgi:hypothetical protein